MLGSHIQNCCKASREASVRCHVVRSDVSGVVLAQVVLCGSAYARVARAGVGVPGLAIESRYLDHRCRCLICDGELAFLGEYQLFT
jgi:hypothetical protein